jgi:hypothetical protein
MSATAAVRVTATRPEHAGQVLAIYRKGKSGEAIVSWDPPGLRLRRAGEEEWKEVPIKAATALERIDRGIAYFCPCVKLRRQVEEATGMDGVRAVELAQSVYRIAGPRTQVSNVPPSLGEGHP